MDASFRILPNQDLLVRMVLAPFQTKVADRRYFSVESTRRIDSQLEGSDTPAEPLSSDGLEGEIAVITVHHSTKLSHRSTASLPVKVFSATAL